MKIKITKITLLALIAGALVAVPAGIRAEDSTNTPAAAPAPASKKHSPQFHGKVSAVDAAGETIAVNKLTIQITSKTKITKDGKPATLSDIAVDDTVSGTYKKDDAGKLNAVSVHDGKAKKKTTPPTQ